jgi:4-hydroxybenzoate polyprenyltransferase
MKGLWSKVAMVLEMIKFEHTVFALPFAFMGCFLAAGGFPPLSKLFWIVVAMVGARTGAMCFNRLVDAEIDAKNPRTKERHIPAGKVSKRETMLFVVGSYAVFIFAAKMLNPLCFKLAPWAVLLISFYSFTKRFTWASHIVLGLSLSLAPIGAWIAVRGTLNLPPVLVGLGVAFWVGGFDILYSLQDIDFDKQEGLHSIPSLLGVERALWVARGFHVASVLFFALVAPLMHLGSFYLLGLLVMAGLLFWEHRLVSPNDLSKIDMAFFTVNGYLSVAFFIFTALDLMVGG